ncbi:MAG: hypothetical protein GEU86_22495 [Actinophytocola sp.]|nr:hypothetical protein [Actinophytocola sp.]
MSTTEVPTGAMIVDPSVAFPQVDGVTRRIDEAVREGVWFDARGLADRLFGDDQYANMLLVGAAYQTGALRLPASAIERAIELNGAAVAAQHPGVPARAAGGRRSQRVRTPRARAGVSRGPGARALRVTRNWRGWSASGRRTSSPTQNQVYADRYVADVERVRAAEAAAVPGSTELAEAIARNLYKLMAYKDEYEVARLAINPKLGGQIEEQFGAGARYSWKLHPPILRALGMRRKVTLGRWFTPAFLLLRKMRGLRGTRWDVFGYAPVRRLERELIAEYREVLGELLASLTPASHRRAIEIAGLPDMVRGYEEVKSASIADYRHRLRTLVAQR